MSDMRTKARLFCVLKKMKLFTFGKVTLTTFLVARLLMVKAGKALHETIISLKVFSQKTVASMKSILRSILKI